MTRRDLTTYEPSRAPQAWPDADTDLVASEQLDLRDIEAGVPSARAGDVPNHLPTRAICNIFARRDCE
jgi:hypothetical protein